MGKHDNRTSMKMRARKAQAKKKARTRRRAEERAARFAASQKSSKK